jgi:cytochrome P450
MGHKLPPSPTSRLRDLTRDPLNYFLTLTRQYGDVVCYRTAPEPAYLVNHPESIKHILVLNSRNYRKDTYTNNMFKSAIGDGLLTSEGEVWRQQRRLMQPAFHQQRIARFSELIVQETAAVLERWQDFAVTGRPLDIAEEMATLTLRIIGRSLFGVDLSDKASTVGQAVNMAADLLEKPRQPRFQEALAVIEQIVFGIINERRRSNQDTGDLLSALLLTRDEETGQGMDDQQLRNQVITLLLAGYETTATALTWTWYLLSQHPEIQRRLHGEAASVLDGRLPAYSDLPRLGYVQMMFEEVMRLYPPAWIMGRRALGNDMIGGYFIPHDSIIAISPFTLHRHPGFWEQPEVFDPERFSPERSAGRHRFAYLPFGAGPRQCIGNNFAMLEAQLIIAAIAQMFALQLLPGQSIRTEPLFILRPNGAVMMTVHEQPHLRSYSP